MSNQIQDKPAEKRKRGNPKWAKDPQTGKGQSGNPGGQPEWVASVRDSLMQVTQDGAAVLGDIVRGVPVDVEVDGEVCKVTPQVRDRLTAIKLAFEYTLPKPDAEALAKAIKESGAPLTREEALLAVKELTSGES
jgi:hypothetical protein